MLVQYASDLHLEFQENYEFLRSNPLEPKGEVLILAGDIVPFALRHKHADFFNYVADHFPVTYWLPGNHEYYNSDIADKSGTVYEKIRDNVFLVNNIRIEKNNISFIFSTLWTKIEPVNKIYIEKRMADFKLILEHGKRFTTEKYSELHKESFQIIVNELNNKKAPHTIVATHHVPTFSHYPEKYKGDILNEAFAAEMSETILTFGLDYWIFGHHHVNIPPFTIGKTQMLTNQLGYVGYGENEGFSLNKVIRIGV